MCYNVTWLSVKEVADLLGYSERAIRDKATKYNEFKYRYIDGSAGRGGKKLEILLESLPEQAQIAYHNKKGDIQPVINTEYTHTTKAQKEKGKLKSTAIVEYNQFYKECKKNNITSETKIMELYLEQWNNEHPEFTRSRSSFYRWLKLTKRGDADKLVDKRGGHNRGKSSIPKVYQEYFLNLYLQQTKPSRTFCYNQTKLLANENGDIIPGIKAFKNLIKNLPEALIIRKREGKKAFEDKCEPYTERDYSLLDANDWWVADHHEWDIFVRIPDGKGGWKLERPWGSYWMDMRTRKVMSSIIRIESPNSDIVLCSFGLGVKEFGIPKGVRLDNGKDYKAKDLFQSDELEHIKSKFCKSVAENLQMDYTYAIPYNAKAKPIERLFNTFEAQLGKQYPSYAGSNAKQRPEDLKDVPIMDIITLEEFIQQHKQYVYEIYNKSSHTGNSMYKQAPDEVWKEELEKHGFKLRGMPKEDLYFSLMRVKGKRKIGRNGIQFNHVHYHNPNFQHYFGTEVIAKYDPTKPELLYVFDLDENFLFLAEEVKKRGWTLSKEDYQEMNETKKIAKQVIMNTYPTNNTPRDTETIGERLQRQAEALNTIPEAEPKTVELVRNPKIEENVRKINLSDMERAYENIIKEQKQTETKTTETQHKMVNQFKQKMLDRAYKRQA